MCQMTHHVSTTRDGLDELRGLSCVHALCEAVAKAGLTLDDHEIGQAIEQVRDHGVATLRAFANPWRSEHPHDVEITLHWADHHQVRIGYTLTRIEAAA